MASKAYVASLTLSELKQELKQRGLSARGGKKELLRDRLEQALDEEELDDPSSESDGEGAVPLQGTGFNFEVLPESFIKEETPEEEVEPMIVSVELSDKENLEVYPHRLLADEGWGQTNEAKGPMIVAIELKSARVLEEQGLSPLTEGREVAGNSEAQTMAQQVETPDEQDDREEVDRGHRSAQEEAAVRMEDEQEDRIQQAAVQEVEIPVAVEDSARPQPSSSADTAPQAGGEQPVETHEKPDKVESSCMPDQHAAPDVTGEETRASGELTPPDVKVEEPDQITVPDVSEVQEPSGELEQTSQINTPPESCPMEEQKYEEEPKQYMEEEEPSPTKEEEERFQEPTQRTEDEQRFQEPTAPKEEEESLQEPTQHTEEVEQLHEEVMKEQKVNMPAESLPGNTSESVENSTEGDMREGTQQEQHEVESSERRQEDTGDSRELDQPVEQMEFDQPEAIATEMVDETEQQIGAEVLLPPAVDEKGGGEPCDEGSVGGRAEGEGVGTVLQEESKLEQPAELGELCTQAEGPAESDREAMEAKQTEYEHPLTEQQDKETADSSGMLPPAGEESGISPPAGEESGILPPAGEESGISPPAGEESEVSPPAGEESGISPPAGEESGVSPPADEKSGVLPPAGEESEVSPLAGEESGISPPADEELTERVSTGDSNLMGQVKGAAHETDTGPGTMPKGEAEMEVRTPGEEEERNGVESAKGEEEGQDNHLRDHKSVAQMQEGEESQWGEGDKPSAEEGRDLKPDLANPKEVEQGTEHVEEVEAARQEDPGEESAAASGERAAGEGQGVDEAKLDSGSDLEQGGTDATPPQEEGEVSLLVESGQIDVDVLVHAEEDDLSVFSTEAAEAQALTTTRDRDRKAKHSSSSRRSNGHSRKREQVASSRSGNSHTRNSPPDNSKRQREHKPEPQCEQPSIKRRRISAQGSSSVDNSSSVSGTQERRRRWGSAKQRSGSTSAATISSDVLKDIIPAGLEEEVGMEGGGVAAATSALDNVKGYGGEEEEGEVVSEKGTGEEENEGQENEQLDAEHQREWEDVEKEREVKRRAVERARQEVETRKRIEARLRAKQQVEAKLKMEEKVKHRTPSPARNPLSRILHVEHLTRPFTVMQLKELLTQDGPMISDSFWTNKIKSHCIVLYKSQESAVATRTRMHGIKWPSTNPKLLCVEYLTPGDVELITKGEMVVRMGEEEMEEENEEKEEEGEVVRESVEEERMEVEVEEEGGREEEEVLVRDTSSRVRQASASSPPAPPSPKGVEKRAGKREVDPPPAKEETDKTTKLLDELFRKTKTTPSIYWLPLNDAQVKERQDLMRAREAEREKQRQERARLRQEEREREDKERREREERNRKERERRIREERERRAKERMRRRSRSRSRSRSRDRRRR